VWLGGEKTNDVIIDSHSLDSGLKTDQQHGEIADITDEEMERYLVVVLLLLLAAAMIVSPCVYRYTSKTDMGELGGCCFTHSGWRKTRLPAWRWRPTHPWAPC